MLVTPILPKGRIIVVGDIHGYYKILFKLLKKMKVGAKDCVYLLGDLIDRGPDSKRVLDLAMAWVKQKRMIVLMGNHEHMMLEALTSKSTERHWVKNSGGRETLESFGVESLSEIPKRYINWIAKRPKICKIPFSAKDGSEIDYVLSHAGVDTSHAKPLRATDTNAIYVLWNRDTHPAHKTLVNIVGHTPKKITDIRKSLKASTIYLDGGCGHGHGGNLVGLDLDSLQIDYEKNAE